MENRIPTWLSRPALGRYSGPPVAQITAAVTEAINRGDSQSGDRLPPVRTLAEHLGVAVNTVAKAYKRLEEWNLVEGRGRGGTVVASDSLKVRGDVQEMTRSLLALADRSGVTPEELREMLDTAVSQRDAQRFVRGERESADA